MAKKVARKPVAKKRVAKVAKPKAVKKVLVLRTCDANLKSHGNFQWPASGPVACKDWSPAASCGNGLHGLLWGEGEGGLLSWNPDAKWLVVEVEESKIVDLGGKVKFPCGDVVHCGDRLSATDYLIERLTKAASVVGAIVKAGYRGTATAGDCGTATAVDYGTATAGYYGTATAGDYGTATAGDCGTATAGDCGTATAGYKGTATAGYKGTATAGYKGTLVLSFYDNSADRRRICTAYVGEDGIEPGKKYQLDHNRKFVEVK